MNKLGAELVEWAQEKNLSREEFTECIISAQTVIADITMDEQNIKSVVYETENSQHGFEITVIRTVK